MESRRITVLPLGDRAFTLKWSEAPSPAQLAAKAQSIRSLDFRWLQEVVSAYSTLTFHIQGYSHTLEQAIQELIGKLNQLPEYQMPVPRLVEIPVIYGGEHGPDLAESAKRSVLSEQQFIERHIESTYAVAMIGFAPGFPYLCGLDETLVQPRHVSPRMKVPSGAVGIAGNQTGVYPVSSPGGWQIIGRTAKQLFQPAEPEPFLLMPGDTVKFVQVEEFSEQPIVDDNINNPIKMETNPHSISALRVIKPGLFTTIQDTGRKRWQAYGVSVGGAMDSRSMRVANLLVGNDEDDAVLEFTLVGGSYYVESDLLIALSGADLGATVDGMRLPMNKPLWLHSGTILAFSRAEYGSRCYMAVAGGIDVPLMLGSRSTDSRARIGGGAGRALIEGDSLSCLQANPRAIGLQSTLRAKALATNAQWSTVDWFSEVMKYSRYIKVRVLLGAEWEMFLPESQQRILEDHYRMEASSDRMGLRLAGAALFMKTNKELVSHGVAPGTIQVPSNGQPIILGAGCQPTGGYPKIAHVISADLPKLAQAVPGDWISFELTDSHTAQLAMMDVTRELAILKAGIHLAHSRELRLEGVVK